MDHMQATSPPESVHALDLSALRSPDVTFWSIWEDTELLGCGALKQLDAHHGEIKSMRTASGHLGRGVASEMLTHMMDTSRQRGYTRISLETGSGEAFEPAHALYLKFGFAYCGPFAQYTEDPFSRFMTLEIKPVTSE
ncbi:MAG: GNAT family N-acetyltransferase [Gammaproteobacteria bacterium]